jgi:hypothetical protein
MSKGSAASHELALVREIRRPTMRDRQKATVLLGVQANDKLFNINGLFVIDPQPPAIFLVGANRFKLTIYTSGYGRRLCKGIGQDAEREGIERVQLAALPLTASSPAP